MRTGYKNTRMPKLKDQRLGKKKDKIPQGFPKLTKFQGRYLKTNQKIPQLILMANRLQEFTSVQLPHINGSLQFREFSRHLNSSQCQTMIR